MSKPSIFLPALLTAVLATAVQAQDPEKPIIQAPQGWHAVESGPLASARFLIEDEGTASVMVTRLSGDGGGLAANIKRWRAQVGLPAVADKDALRAVQPLKGEGITGHLVDLTGPEKAGKPTQRILVAVVKRGDGVWYFRLKGPASLVEAQKAAFDQVLKSVRFEPATPRQATKTELTYAGTSLSAWLLQLNAEDPEKRHQAADALARVARAFDAAIPTLRNAALNSQTSDVLSLLVRLGPAAVPALTQAVWDEDPKTRAVAVFLLGRIGWEARSAVPTLLHALQDPESRVRGLAAKALGDIEAYSAVPRLRNLLDDSDPLVRIVAARALIVLDAEARLVLPVLVKELTHADPDVASTAADVLSLLGPEAAPATADVVKCWPTAPVERQGGLARVLRGIGGRARSAVPALKKAARNNPDPEVALALWAIAQDTEAPALLRTYLKAEGQPDWADAAIALWQMGPALAPPFNQPPRNPAVYSQPGFEADAVAALVRMVKVDRTALRAIELLGMIGPEAKDAVPALVARLSHPQAALRSNAALVLGRIGPAARDALPALGKAGEEEDDTVRLAALVAACRIKPDLPAVAALARQLTEKVAPNLREYALRELGWLGKAGKPAVPTLRKALTDPNEFVRMAAANALWRIDRDPAGLPVLVALLQAPDAGHRSQAAQHIGYEFGTEGQSAVPALIKLLWDPSIDVRSSAGEELGRIGSKAAPAVPALVAVLEGDGHIGNLTAACEALGRIGPKAGAAVPALKRLLAHPCKLVQVHAGLALRLVAQDDTGAKELEAGLTDRNYRVRITAAEAVWQMKKDERVVPLLLHSLRHSNLTGDPNRNNELFMAIRALGRIGPLARDAVPSLVRRLMHADRGIAETAATALRHIDPEAAKANGLN